MDDSQIIDLFFVRSELAISELDAKYGKVCHKLAHNILNSRQDAEECVNDAYLGTWNAIPPQRPDPLLPFVCVLVRRYSIMRYRANTAMKRNSSYDACMEEIEKQRYAGIPPWQERTASVNDYFCSIHLYHEPLLR